MFNILFPARTDIEESSAEPTFESVADLPTPCFDRADLDRRTEIRGIAEYVYRYVLPYPVPLIVLYP